MLLSDVSPDCGKEMLPFAFDTIKNVRAFFRSFHQTLQRPAHIKQVSSITERFTSKSACQFAAKLLSLTRSRFAYTVSNLDHCTPLICALLMESFDCAALLIAAGADQTIPNKNGNLEILGMQSANRLLVGVVSYYL